MNLSRRITNISGAILLNCALGAAASSPARAETATYVAPAFLDQPTLTALSTSGDSAGALLGLGETLALVFDNLFATTRADDSVSIFTLAPDNGWARASVRFGVYNYGAPTIVFSRNIRAGRTLTINNLFNRGCSAFGGCDYIEILTTRLRGGANGVEVDYVDVNGAVTTVTAPTPEPASWALMILGFCLIAWRLKAARRISSDRSGRTIPLAAA